MNKAYKTGYDLAQAEITNYNGDDLELYLKTGMNSCLLKSRESGQVGKNLLNGRRNAFDDKLRSMTNA